MKAKKIKIILAVSAIIVLVFVSFVLLRKYPFFADITSGKLVLSYDFQTITDGKIIDGSGNTPSLDGIMHGGTIVDVGEAPALQLNGTSDYVEVPSSDLLGSNSTNEMSFEISFKSDNYSPRQTLLSRRAPCDNEGHFKIYTQNSSIFFSYYSNLDKITDVISSDHILENGKSYKIYFLKKWGTVGAVLYVNGMKVHLSGEDSLKATTYTNLPTFIGAQNGPSCASTLAPSYFFKGMISDVKVWNKFLSPDEIEGLSTSPVIPDVVITSGNIKLAVDQFGYIRSLKYNNAELLLDNASWSIGKLITKSGSNIPAASFTAVSDNIYDITYPGSDVVTKIKISPEENNRIVFSLISQSGSTTDIESVDLFDFSKAKHIAQSSGETGWAKSAAGTEPFILSLPLNESTVCTPSYNCYGAQVLGVTNAQAALIVTPKSDYFTTIEKFIDDKNLPKVMTDGTWFRADPSIGDDYLFATLTSSNASSLVDQAKKGGFKQVLLQDPFVYGHYNQPKASLGFSNQDDFYNAIDQFTKNGIKVGIHTFIGKVSPVDSFFSQPSQSLQKFPVGTITTALTASKSNTGITTSEDIAGNANYKYFNTTIGKMSTTSYYLVDDEIMNCSIPTPQTDPPGLKCTRGWASWTSSVTHPVGSPIYLLAYQLGAFYINYENKAVFDESIASFKTMAERFGVNFFYFDGGSGMPATNNPAISSTYSAKNTLFPYLAALTNKPAYQTGGGTNSFGYYYHKRAASWDGAEFQPKNFTKGSKAQLLNGSQNPYSQIHYEMGWWKFIGARTDQTGSGNNLSQFDLEATTFDDVHYAMTKVVAFGSSIGLQLGAGYTKLNGLDSLYGIINKYKGLIAKQKTSPLIPQNILDYLKLPDHEAALTNTAGYQFIERRVFDQFITPEIKTFSVNNKFDAQKLKVSVRPQPDYKGFDDSGNTLMTDFSNATVAETSHDKVQCTITNGQVTLINNVIGALGSCKINIPGTFNLANKRGIGLQMTGDGKNEMVVVGLTSSPGRRDFATSVDFSGQKTFILGTPTTNITDKIGNLSTVFGQSDHFRSWSFNYASSAITAQIVIHTKPGTYTVTLNSLKALAEKDSSVLKNPTIEIAGKKITFPVSLSYNETDPNILEYDGSSRTYKLYSSNYAPLGEGVIDDDSVTVANGSNEIKFSSDENASNSQRASIKIIANDDKDNDGIPTNGNYSEENKPCSSSSDFCDDNRPDFYNPKQNLSPIIESVNVTDGQVISENPYIVTAKVSDVSQIAKVEFYVDDNLIGTSTLPDISGSYEAVWDTSKYHSTVKVVAYDTTGSKTEISRSAQIPSSASSIDNNQIVTILPKTGWRSWFDSVFNQVSKYLNTIF